MTVRRFPASYQNTPVREALAVLAEQPSLAGLEALLAASVRGGLAVDLTGSTPESGTRVRTIVSTDGRPVLPLFTSIAEVKLAVAMTQPDDGGTGKPGSRGATGIAAQAAILPAIDALALIRSDEFVAVQFDPGSTAQVVARAHIETALERAAG
ncbi:MAG: SseB family protein [Microbacteriaceae bacterium]